MFFAGNASAQKNKGAKNKQWKLVWSNEFNLCWAVRHDY